MCNLIIKSPHTSIILNNNNTFECTDIVNYLEFKNNFLNELKKKNYKNMTLLINNYSHSISIKQKNNKFYSSFLEEIPLLLSHDYIVALIYKLKLNHYKFQLGNCKSAISVVTSLQGNFTTLTKDIDYCLAIESTLNNSKVLIPLIGLEVKKYCDKTMFSSILDTYYKLHTINPYIYYGFLTIHESRSKIAIDSSPILENEFLLSKNKRNNKNLGITIDKFLLKQFTESLFNIISNKLNKLKSTS